MLEGLLITRIFHAHFLQKVIFEGKYLHVVLYFPAARLSDFPPLLDQKITTLVLVSYMQLNATTTFPLPTGSLLELTAGFC